MGITSSGAPHHSMHENGGADEVDATGLTGVGGGGGSPLKITRAYRSGANQSIPDTTLTAVLLDTEAIDDEALHSTVTNTSRVTIATTDVYDIIAAVQWDSDATGTYRRLNVFQNGSSLIDSAGDQAPVANKVQYLRIEGVSLTAGDYVEVKVQQDSGSARTIVSGFRRVYLIVRRGTDFPAFEFDGASRLLLKTAYDEIAQSDQSDDTYASIYLYDGDLSIITGDTTHDNEINFLGGSGQINMAVTDGVHDSTFELHPNQIELNTTGNVFFVGGGVGTWFKFDTSDGVVFPSNAADPTGTFEGQTYFNSVSKKLRCWNGTTWNDLF